MFLVSNLVLSFQLYLFPIFLISFYSLLIAIKIQFSVTLLSCLLKFIYLFTILEKINISGSTELFMF